MPDLLRMQAADLWSVGVILFAMLIGRYPFSQRESNVARNIVSATYSLPDDVQVRACARMDSCQPTGGCMCLHQPSWPVD